MSSRRAIPLACLLGCLLAGPAWAQHGLPVTQASVADLIEALSDSGPVTKSFRPTRKPGPDGLCGDQLAARSTAAKNLVVEYADESAPRVELAVQYKLNSDQLGETSIRLLDTLALALNSPQLAEHRFALAGHADLSGTADHNLRLSCARSLAALNHLISKGVRADRLTAYGFGSSQLLPGPDPTSAVHRRVEVRRAEQR